MVAMDQSPLCMAGVLKMYEQLRAEGNQSSIPFWDVVVLTTADEIQQSVYELEIKNKLALGELPSCAKYYVEHDPPGAKIGSGGSTMYALSKLAEKEPNYKSYKVMLMHAGGLSQRLPSASILGKAFTAIPLGDILYTMFDVKLAMCLPFVDKLPCGVFICCPDTFEPFTFGNMEEFDLGSQPGFVALAHPSPLCLGIDHGVYILSDLNSDLDTEVLSCEKVLQKPSERLMRDEGAVVNVEDVPANIRRASPTNEDWVFTDSNFFFDHTISEKLIDFYQKNSPLTDELCAYGDFLQPLGARAADVYINNCKNIISISKNTLSTRRKVFELLRGSPLKIITLKQSKFYHIGTMAEYLESFCDRSDLREELGLSTFCFSALIGDLAATPLSIGGCIMHSLVSPSSHFHDRSVIEFCQFMGPVIVQNDSVISNCVYSHTDPVSIPANTFMQTVPVYDDADNVKYVTLAFSVGDDMKAKADSLTDTTPISYFKRSLSDICHVLNVCPADIFSRDSPITLWHAKLFPLSDTPQQSFLCALDIIRKLISPVKRRAATSKDIYFTSDASADSVQCYNDPSPVINGSNTAKCMSNCSQNTISPISMPSNKLLYSFADVVRRKNANLMIQQRNELAKKIRYAMSATV